MIDVREPVAQLLKHLFWMRADPDLKNGEIEDLARALADYARMRLDLNPEEAVFVEVEELAFRFREDRRAIRRALDALEGQRRAEKTKFDGLWKLLG